MGVKWRPRRAVKKKGRFQSKKAKGGLAAGVVGLGVAIAFGRHRTGSTNYWDTHNRPT